MSWTGPTLTAAILTVFCTMHLSLAARTSAGDDEDEEAEEPVQAVLQLPQQLDLPEGVKRNTKKEWDTLQSMVQELRPIERFRVVGIAFRRCCKLLCLDSG